MKETATFWRTLSRRDRAGVIRSALAGLAAMAAAVVAVLIIF